MDCSPPSSSVHGILQARILEWVAISFSRGTELTAHSNTVWPHLKSIIPANTLLPNKVTFTVSRGCKESDTTERLHFHFNSVWLVFLWEGKGHRNRQGKTLCDDGDGNHVTYKASDTNVWQQPPEIRREVWNRFCLRASGRDHPCWYLDLRLLASRTEITYFCCLKPSGLWQFVTVTLGHSHTLLCVSSPWEF